MKKYFGNWEDYDEMVNDWFKDEFDYETKTYKRKIIEDMAKDEEILFAVYGTYSYEGEAQVLFKRDGKLFEVTGSHCSCNGLETCWEPAEVTWKALAMRNYDKHKINTSWGDKYDAEALKFLCNLIKKNLKKGELT